MTSPNWECMFRLGDACKVKHGFPFKSEYMTTEDDHSLPIVVNIVNFQYRGGFRFESTKIQRYKGDYPKEYILNPGDILVVMTCQTPNGEILGIPGRIPDDGNTYLHNQRMGLVEITDPEKIDANYVYYLFLSPEFNQHLCATATGAKILHTAPSRIENYKFARPPLGIQRKIGRVLSAFDSLIEKNTQRSRILEEIVQTTYLRWFVHRQYLGHKNGRIANGFTPEEWKVERLSNLVKEVRGKSYRSSNLGGNEGIPFITLNCIDRDGGFRVDGLKQFSGRYEEKHTAKSGDIMIALTDITQERRVIGRAARVPDIGIEKFVYSMDLLKLVPLCDYDREFLNGLCRYSQMPSKLKEYANGVNVLHLGQKHISSYEFLLPPEFLRREYSEIVSAIYRQNDLLTKENMLLRDTRDLTLPKLISGEVGVSKEDVELSGN